MSSNPAGWVEVVVVVAVAVGVWELGCGQLCTVGPEDPCRWNDRK